MGGKGAAPEELRELSQVEIALLDEVLQLILDAWSAHWSKIQPVVVSILGHESTGQFLRTSPADALMFVLGMEARINECVEQLQMALPVAALESVLEKIRLQSNLREANPKSAVLPNPLKWNRILDDIEVPLVADWAGVKLTARQLANLKIGDVVPLAPEFALSVRLSVAKAPKFVGRLGTCEQKWAVEITEVTRPEQLSHL